MSHYNLVVIGGGPGGYSAALEGVRLKASVALVENDRIGGACLHRGCIPTKSLYESLGYGEAFADAIQRRGTVVGTLEKGLKNLLKEIIMYRGKAYFESPQRVRVGEGIISADNVVIATGSVPIAPEGGLTSDDIITLQKVPPKITFVGGGYIGCEYGHIFGGYGSKVRIFEALPRILSTEDEDIVREVIRSSKMKRIEILTGTKYEPRDEGDSVFYTIGRQANLPTLPDGESIRELGFQLAKNGAIEVNNRMETTVKHVYAVGDVIDKPFRLAHVAEEEGKVAARNALDFSERSHRLEMGYDRIPTTIFTDPMITSVGTREQELEKGIYVVGKCYYRANPMAQCEGNVDGFAKIIVDTSSHEILGASAVGLHMDIHEIVTAMEAEATIETLANSIHFHPSRAEVWKRAAESVLEQL